MYGCPEVQRNTQYPLRAHTNNARKESATLQHLYRKKNETARSIALSQQVYTRDSSWVAVSEIL